MGGNVSRPNYSYCVEYCPGKIPNCPHYSGHFGAVCDTYKALMKLEPKRTEKGVSRSELERLVMLAGSIK